MSIRVPRRTLRTCFMHVAALATVTLGGCTDASDQGAGHLTLRVDGEPVAAGDPVAFAPTPVGGQATSRRFELVNAGPGPLTLTGQPAVALRHDDHLAFHVQQPDVAGPVVPGAVVPFTVTFRPLSDRDSTARLEVAHDGPAEPFSVHISGRPERSEPDDTPPVGELTLRGEDGGVVDALDVGLSRLGQPRTATLTVFNGTTAPLSLNDSVSVTGDDAAAYTTVVAGAASVPPNGAGELIVQFTPSRCGAHDAELVLQSTGLAEDARIALHGSGAQEVTSVASGAALEDINAVALAVAEGGRLLAVGDPRGANFGGVVSVYSHSGCGLQLLGAVRGGDDGVDRPLLGSAVAIRHRQRTLLATAQDQPVALLFDLDALSEVATTLTAAGSGAGHGTQAVLSVDGSGALVERNAADHAALFVHVRPQEADWLPHAASVAALVPGHPTVTHFADGVAWARGTELVLASAVGTGDQAGPVALVYRRSEDDPAWGSPSSETNTYFRHPTLRLTAAWGEQVSSLADVGYASGEDAILVAAIGGLGVTVARFDGRDDTWGEVTGDPKIRTESSFTHLPAMVDSTGQIAFDPTAGTLYIAAFDGLRRYDAADLNGPVPSPRERWDDVLVALQLSVSPEGGAVTGLSAEGTVHVILVE